MPFAAFFVAFLLLLCIPRRSRKLALCLLLGALAGLCAVHTTSARLERVRANYAGRTVLLTAEVERADSNYFSDTVDATLWVESVNGSPAGFRIACAELPACAAGQRVQGWFALQQPDMEEQTAQYADGIALQAEPVPEKPQLTVLGESGSFRARTHRLQQKLSESLCRAMHRDTGGVLAAMTVGDRSGLSAQLRRAYRGAGLSHVLVVSGMHVSILCGDILSVLLPYRWEQSYRSRRRRAVSKSLLAAMTVGDRSGLSAQLRRAYRGAGLSHVLVVSGMHVSILCGDILSVLLPYRWEQSYRSRRRRAVSKSLLALVLMGVTGFTPSVRRAAVAVWVSALGVWVWGPPDALTSLAAAGILMTTVNSYAVWDIGFELSFAAVVGTVAGNACIRRMRDAHDRRFWVKAGENLQKPVRRPWYSKLPKGVQGLVESACIAACASAATFPVLVLRGLSVSAWAVVSSIAVLWMVQPLLLLGLAVAFVGLVPWLAPVHGVLSRAADLLTGLLNGWVVWLSTKPGASIYFDTAYAALVCLLLCGLGVLAFRWRVRLRVALPGILLTAAVGIGLGNALSRDVVHIDLVGSAQAPAVVIAQNDRAVVLFRGGNAAQRAVENQLARRGVRTVELVADLRMNAKTACTLPAQQGIRAERLPVNASRKLRCTPAAVELLRTREGCLVRLSIGNRQFVTLSGKAELAQPLQTEWLIATPKKPETVRYQKLLAMRSYSWMTPETQYTSSLSLRRTGGERLE